MNIFVQYLFTDIVPPQALFDCSTTSTQNADTVIQELHRVLTEMNIKYTRKST